MDTKYIGMDVHKETIAIAVMNSAGKLVIESILETEAMTILQFAQGSRGIRRRNLARLVVRPSQALRHESRGVQSTQERIADRAKSL